MRQEDFGEFSELVTDLAASYPGRVTLTPGMLAMMFRALSDHSLDDVRGAMDAHLKHPTDCKFFPMPGQLIGHIREAEADDGRPTADEAWAIAAAAVEEGATVVWTAEIAQAWGACLSAFEPRNTNPARMAFRDTYTKLVNEARQHRVRAHWSVSEGHDPERRRCAVEAAVAAGRLTHDQAAPLLNLPLRTDGTPLLAGPQADNGVPAHVLQRLQALRSHLTGPRDLSEARAAEAEKLAAAKAEAERLVAVHTRVSA